MTEHARPCWRVVVPVGPPLMFYTEGGANVAAAIRNARDPRAPLAVVEYRDPDDPTGAWHRHDATLSPSRIPPAPGGPTVP